MHDNISIVNETDREQAVGTKRAASNMSYLQNLSELNKEAISTLEHIKPDFSQRSKEGSLSLREHLRGDDDICEQDTDAEQRVDSIQRTEKKLTAPGIVEARSQRLLATVEEAPRSKGELRAAYSQRMRDIYNTKMVNCIKFKSMAA